MSDTAIRLEHALIDVGDLSKSLEFYGKLFPGWTVRWEGRNDRGGRWAHFGPPGQGQPGYLSLYEIPGIEATGESYGGKARIEHVGFAHPDVEALAKRMSELGIPPSDHVEGDGYRRYYFTDPDGHNLEFVQAL